MQINQEQKEFVMPLPEVTEQDIGQFMDLVSIDLGGEQERQITEDLQPRPGQKEVLAVHWHQEHVPLELVRQRLKKIYPDSASELIIPTQHNEFTSFDGEYAGAELDCFSKGFNQKVQLLVHLKEENLRNASVLKDMAEYTFKYRSSQLFDFMDSIISPSMERVKTAAARTGADETVVEFVRIMTAKVMEMLQVNMHKIPRRMIKNKLLTSFLDKKRAEYGDAFINRGQAFLKEVKRLVKEGFPTRYFYRTREVIEEARSVGACIVIPHPEQFWPVLLADYDVDGIEVWNPQSHKYTDFLISVLIEKNRRAARPDRRLLVFMGDDTHMGEKTKHPSFQKPEKAWREIGFQDAWNDMNIKKRLILANMDRGNVITEYRERLG